MCSASLVGSSLTMQTSHQENSQYLSSDRCFFADGAGLSDVGTTNTGEDTKNKMFVATVLSGSSAGERAIGHFAGVILYKLSRHYTKLIQLLRKAWLTFVASDIFLL